MSVLTATPRIGDTRPGTTAPDDVVQMGGGYAFPDLLPDVSQIARNVASDFRTEALQYGPLFGLPDLRDAIVESVRADGVACGRDNILVLNGAKQALDLLLRVMVRPGDPVIVSHPTYLTALSIIRSHGAELIEVDLDHDGMKVDTLAQMLAARRSRGDSMPKLLFEVPDFHNPTGVTLSAARRQRLVELAEEFGFFILEDDPYRKLRFAGTGVPPIKSFDRSGRVIGAGTVSKIFAPGIRVGWANGDPDIIGRMAAAKSEGGCCPFTQRIVLEAMRTGLIDHHITELSEVMAAHLRAMCASIDRHLPDARYNVPNGGYFLWLELPADVSAAQVTLAASASGAAIFSGDLFFGTVPAQGFVRLCFATSTPERIDLGIRRIAEAIHRLRESPEKFVPGEATPLQRHTD
ncbi:MAG: PLP-dependent aminotransferase family protein [Rhodobacteraceae bacterium]|nr:PLP-dependent aminotransferase family protein [Paracoccaceae bacterium]